MDVEVPEANRNLLVVPLTHYGVLHTHPPPRPPDTPEVLWVLRSDDPMESQRD